MNYIITNSQPITQQEWHHHEKVWETLFIIEGELHAQWKEKDELKQQTVKAGDIIETQHSPHIFMNKTNNVAKFLVIKQLLTGENKQEILKTDKVLD